MIIVRHKGSLDKTRNFLKRASDLQIRNILEKYGQQGVAALAAATPQDTGNTAASWGYTVESTSNGWSIAWTNSVMAGTAPLVILLQYGHGTGTGGYVQGRDFINPATQAVFDQIAEEAWRGVIRG